MRSVEFSLLTLLLLCLVGNVKAATPTHYVYAVSEDCKVFVDEFDQSTQNGIGEKLKAATKAGDCSSGKAAVLHHKGHLLVIQRATDTAVKLAYKYIEKTTGWVQLNFSEMKLQLNSNTTKCKVADKISAFIDFHVLHIVVQCTDPARFGFSRSLVFSNGEIRTPPDPVMPTFVTAKFDNVLAISTDDFDSATFETTVYYQDGNDWFNFELHRLHVEWVADNPGATFQTFTDPVAGFTYIGSITNNDVVLKQVSHSREITTTTAQMQNIAGIGGAKLVFAGKAPIAVLKGLGPRLNFTLNALADTGLPDNETYFKAPLHKDQTMCDVAKMQQNVNTCAAGRDTKRMITIALFSLAGFEFLSILGTLMIFTLCICRRRRRIKHRKGKGKGKKDGKDDKSKEKSKNEKKDDKDKSRAGSQTKSK